MDPPAPIHYVHRMSQLRYLHVFAAAPIFISGIEHLSQSKEISLVLKNGVENYGWVVLNLGQVADAREVDYCLCAMEQSLEAPAVDEQALEMLEFFINRFSAERSVCDEDSVRAVVTAVRGVVRAARSPRVEGDDDVGNLARLVKGATRAVTTVFFSIVRAARSPRVEGDDDVGNLARLVKGTTRAVTTVFFGVVRAARSPRAAVAELASVGRSRGIGGDNTCVRLARAALGEVRAARARPVVLANDRLMIQVASAVGVAELLRAAPPRAHGVWSSVRVLDVGGLAHLSDSGHVYCELERCCRVGWQVPNLKKVRQARRLDSHFIVLNHRLKSAFKLDTVREDGSVDLSMLNTVGEQGKEIVRLCSDDIDMFQAEVATLPDVLLQIVGAAVQFASPEQAKEVRGAVNTAMMIIRHIRLQHVWF